MKLFRRPSFLSVLVALALLLGGVARGMAEGAAAARETLVEMVICAEDGATTILLDRHGNAVSAGDCDLTFCPDCLQAAAFGLSPVAVQPMPVITVARAALPAATPVPVLPRTRLAQARAPPMQKA